KQTANVTYGQPPAGRGGGGGRGGRGGGQRGGGPGGFAAAAFGVQGENASEDKGAKITEVTAGTPAAAGGLLANDVVKKVGDKDIKTYQDLIDAITAPQTGSTLRVEVARGTETQTLAVAYNPQFGRGGRGGGGGGGGGGRGGGARWNWDTPYIISPH